MHDEFALDEDEMLAEDPLAEDAGDDEDEDELESPGLGDEEDEEI